MSKSNTNEGVPKHVSDPIGREKGVSSGRGFTLIELLVVISIIGVLAGLIVGLSGLAGRKSKESRIRTEMARLTTAIENYKSALGFYPPDHQINDNAARPYPNQLFYELSGTVYQNGLFSAVGRQEPLSAAAIQTWFGSSGFANAQRDARDLKFIEHFKASETKRVSDVPPIDVLAVPVPGPTTGPMASSVKMPNGTVVNPWLYISTSPTNNPNRFDLWTHVLLGGKIVRFSNWERDPVVIGP